MKVLLAVPGTDRADIYIYTVDPSRIKPCLEIMFPWTCFNASIRFIPFRSAQFAT